MLADLPGGHRSAGAVSDSSPLILCARLGRLELLHALFDEVLVPPAVWREVVTRARDRIGAQQVRQAGWIRRQQLSDHELATQVATLHPGEAEVIALASSIQAAVPILLDDLRARRVAQSLGFTVIGSGGLLGRAKEASLISLVRPTLNELIAAGLYLSETAVRELLEIAGER